MSLDGQVISEHRVLTGKRISELTEFLASGRCKSFDEYKRITGVISGLIESLELIAEAKKNYLNDDFED